MERIKILTILNELETPVNINNLASKADLTRGRILGFLNGLVKFGYVEKRGKYYTIATKGKIALRKSRQVNPGKEFHFYIGIGQYTGISAKSLEEFLDRLKSVDAKSLEFHMARGDFEAWIRDVFNDQEMAREFVKLKNAGIKGEDLRTKLLEVVGAYKVERSLKR